MSLTTARFALEWAAPGVAARGLTEGHSKVGKTRGRLLRQARKLAGRASTRTHRPMAWARAGGCTTASCQGSCAPGRLQAEVALELLERFIWNASPEPVVVLQHLGSGQPARDVDDDGVEAPAVHVFQGQVRASLDRLSAHGQSQPTTETPDVALGALRTLLESTSLGLEAHGLGPPVLTLTWPRAAPLAPAARRSLARYPATRRR